ncbi:hypothetical protein GCM10028787_31540 [Brachybacterium horti]
MPYSELLRDATGKIARYRPWASNEGTQGRPEVPERPHPDEILRVRFSGFGIPHASRRPLSETIDYYAAHPDSEGEPISGDEVARFRHFQCGDPDPDPETACRGPEHCPAAPHRPGTGWVRGAQYRDIAHVLYPGGTVPVRVKGAGPALEVDEQPVQLDLLDYLNATA